MTKRLLESMLAVGVVSVLALSAATPTLGQTQQRQRAPAQQDQGFRAGPQDETFGQASPRAPRSPAAQQCWVPTNEDQGMGYWGECSVKGARPTK
jgi:type II secretory pathway pseudopilin PulG